MPSLTPESAFRRAAAACARREHCRTQWTAKFKAAGLSPQEAEEVADRLEKEGYIDEQRYAKAFTHDKALYDRWGRIKIAAALREKGIAAHLVRVAAEDIDEQDYREALRAVLRQKARTLAATPEAERRMKLARHAATRGYEPEYVWEEVDKIIRETGEDY